LTSSSLITYCEECKLWRSPFYSFLQPHVTFFPLMFKYSPREPSAMPMQKLRVKLCCFFFYILFFTFLDRRWENKRFWIELYKTFPELNVLFFVSAISICYCLSQIF
jgi:hypothetical protein